MTVTAYKYGLTITEARVWSTVPKFAADMTEVVQQRLPFLRQSRSFTDTSHLLQCQQEILLRCLIPWQPTSLHHHTLHTRDSYFEDHTSFLCSGMGTKTNSHNNTETVFN